MGQQYAVRSGLGPFSNSRSIAPQINIWIRIFEFSSGVWRSKTWILDSRITIIFRNNLNMTNENICKWEKFGYCRKKNDCPDYHPIEVCNEEVCNESKCHKRHPQPCRFFRTGTCKFGESCKYDHKQQILISSKLIQS